MFYIIFYKKIKVHKLSYFLYKVIIISGRQIESYWSAAEDRAIERTSRKPVVRNK